MQTHDGIVNRINDWRSHTSRAHGSLLADQPWVTVAENVAVLTVVLEVVEVTGVTEAVVEAVAGVEAGRMRRKSGCLAPNWAVWYSR